MAANSNIGSGTGVLGVLGHPVGHSLSPRMHNAALTAQNIDMVYLAFDVPPERLREAVAGLRALGFRGVNVTIPHKEAMVHLVDKVDEAASRIGSVNTVVNETGTLIGYNTDVDGFTAALRSVRPQGAAGLTCFVAGAGGAARAVVAALYQEGAREIRVCNRTPQRAMALCDQASTWGSATCVTVDPGDAVDAAAHCDLLVNATSVGLSTDIKESAIPVDILHSDQIVMDLVYGPSLTVLVREAKARGAAAIDGREMLVRQAAGSYELWIGRPAPMDVMRKSISED
jgi:shikimate dehydrogenase